MNEVEWVKTFAPVLEGCLRKADSLLFVVTGRKLPYSYEIRSYSDTDTHSSGSMKYETDLLIGEKTEGGHWKPRVIVEAKCRGSITTHDAITYSNKAFTHRQVHPYLRYGILLGERKRFPLPGRLFRHGTQFDFMLSWVGANPSKIEMDDFVDVLTKEVNASRIMEAIIYDSKKRGRDRYTVLHKELKIK